MVDLLDDMPERTVAILITNRGDSNISIAMWDNHTDEELADDASALLIAKGLTGWFAEDPQGVVEWGEQTILEDVLAEVPEDRRERPSADVIQLVWDSDTEGEA